MRRAIAPSEEVAEAWKVEPLSACASCSIARGVLDEAREQAMKAEFAREVEAAVQEYLSTPKQIDRRDVRPSVRATRRAISKKQKALRPPLCRHRPCRRTEPACMPKVTMIEAIAMAQAWELEHDPSVVVLGEDVGRSGGVFRATAGLLERFGADRVQDTPLAENMIAGMCVGMAAQGMKPVAEIQFMGFLYPAIDQIVNHMSRLRHRTRGRMSCPVVLRMPHGGGIHAPGASFRSRSSRCSRTFPGMRVVCPSSPGARLRPVARGDSRSRSGDLPRARAHLSTASNRKSPTTARRCRSMSATRCAKATTSRS